MVDSKNKKVYDPELFTDLLLPLRIGDHWGLLICQMELQRHVVMIFKEWVVDQTITENLEKLGNVIKNLAIEQGCKIQGKVKVVREEKW